MGTTQDDDAKKDDKSQVQLREIWTGVCKNGQELYDAVKMNLFPNDQVNMRNMETGIRIEFHPNIKTTKGVLIAGGEIFTVVQVYSSPHAATPKISSIDVKTLANKECEIGFELPELGENSNSFPKTISFYKAG